MAFFARGAVNAATFGKASMAALGALAEGGKPALACARAYADEQERINALEASRVDMQNKLIAARSKLLDLTAEEAERLKEIKGEKLIELTPAEQRRAQEMQFVGPPLPEGFRPPREEPAARDSKPDYVRFDQLRQIGANALGGTAASPVRKSEEHLKWIRATADKQLAALQEIARGGSRM